MKFGLNSFIDIHTHILPGLDDGAQNIAESIEMARCYESTGIQRVVATPHFLPGTSWASSREKVLDAVKATQASLDSEGIDLQILPGMEIAFHKKMVERVLAHDLIPLGNSDYYLIEPSFHGEQGTFLESLKTLLLKGQKIIVAHPERIEGFQTLDVLQQLLDLDVLIQLNAGSLLGHYGKKSKNSAEEIKKRDRVDFIASDAHNPRKRAPLSLEDWKNIAYSEGGGALLASCVQITTRIFANRYV